MVTSKQFDHTSYHIKEFLMQKAKWASMLESPQENTGYYSYQNDGCNPRIHIDFMHTDICSDGWFRVELTLGAALFFV